MINKGINAENRNAGYPYWGQPIVKNTPDRIESINKWIFFILILKKESKDME